VDASEREERYRRLVEATSDWLWEVDERGCYTFAGPQVETLLGYRPDEVLGRTPFDFMSRAEALRVRELFDAAVQARVPIVRCINRNIHRDGHEVILETSADPIISDGRFVGWRGIDRDVTARVAADIEYARTTDELRQTAAVLENVLDAIPDVIGIQDLDHRILRYNEAGYRFIRTRRPAQVERYFPEGDLWLDVRAYPVVGDDGELSYVIEHLRDVTAQRRAEAALRHGQRLESLGVLAGGIAHDFNNLLTAVAGNVDLVLADLPPTAPQREYLDDALAATRRAAGLCRQMLAYAGKGAVTVGPVSLPELVDELHAMLRVSLSKKVAFELDLDAATAPIQADADQIRQVVMNMVTNAAEAIGDEAGTVTVSTGTCICDDERLRGCVLAQGLPAGSYSFVRVRDTGCGMDAATRERMFEPFFTTKFAGRGLGMAAVLGIVRAHGGALDVQSRPGAGTTMTVYVPVPAVVPAASTVAAEERPSRSADRGLVLVADDEPMVRRVAVSMVRRLGYEVVEAGDGDEALEQYRRHGPRLSCVLLDVAMLKLDGVEALEGLRRLDPAVKVIVVSGWPRVEVEGRWGGRPPAGFLMKPFEVSSLAAELNRVVRGDS